MKMKEKLHKRRIVYDGKIVKFAVDTVILPDGKKAVREYIRHPGAVAVLPFLPGGKIILVKQYRFPVNKSTYEIPAGKLDGKESSLKCVKRELEEETGFKAEKIKKIFSFHPTPAFGTEIIHIFLAEKLRKGQHKPDHDEFLETNIVSFETAVRWISEGKITDSKTVIALLLLKSKMVACGL